MPRCYTRCYCCCHAGADDVVAQDGAHAIILRVVTLRRARVDDIDARYDAARSKIFRYFDDAAAASCCFARRVARLRYDVLYVALDCYAMIAPLCRYARFDDTMSLRFMPPALLRA